jgi:hypothetical protein
MTDRAFALDATIAPSCLRIGYGACDVRELALGVQRLARSLQR